MRFARSVLPKNVNDVLLSNLKRCKCARMRFPLRKWSGGTAHAHLRTFKGTLVANFI